MKFLVFKNQPIRNYARAAKKPGNEEVNKMAGESVGPEELKNTAVFHLKMKLQLKNRYKLHNT